MTRRKVEHIVATTEGVLRCEHCGKEQEIKFPLLVDAFCSLSDKFISEHRFCKEGDRHVKNYSQVS